MVLATKYPFLIQNTRSLFYGRHYSSLHRLMWLHGKLNVKNFLMFIVAEYTRSVHIRHCMRRVLEELSRGLLNRYCNTLEFLSRCLLIRYYKTIEDSSKGVL